MSPSRPTQVIPKAICKSAFMALLLTQLSMPGKAVPVAFVPYNNLTTTHAPHVPYKIGTSSPSNVVAALSPLEARVPPTSYKRAVKKGGEMWAMIQDPLKTRQSTWAATDMQRWGWTVQTDRNLEIFKDKTSGLEAALAVLQMSPATSMTIRLEHNRDVNVDEMEYPATNAEYCGIYNPARGIIVASDRHSPGYRKATSSHLSKSSRLSQLQFWSDLTYLSYQLLSSANSKEQHSPLRYVFIRGITNRTSQQLIMDALKVDGYQHEEILPWPHFWMFTPNGVDGRLSDTFLAVLGTENFAGIAPLLAQHQQGFGERTIKSIRVWGDGGKSKVLHGMVELE